MLISNEIEWKNVSNSAEGRSVTSCKCSPNVPATPAFVTVVCWSSVNHNHLSVGHEIVPYCAIGGRRDDSTLYLQGCMTTGRNPLLTALIDNSRKMRQSKLPPKPASIKISWPWLPIQYNEKRMDENGGLQLILFFNQNMPGNELGAPCFKW